MNKLTAKDFKRGVRVVKSQLTDFDNYPVYQNSLKPLGFYSKYNVKANTVFVICAGAAGDIGFSNKNFWAADDCYYLETDKYVDSKFIYYYLLSIQNDIKRQVRQASVPRLGSNVLKSIILPSVSDNKQQEIVKILDSFTNLIDALNKELSLRQKQFEYYREKLLTFDDNVYLMRLGDCCVIKGRIGFRGYTIKDQVNKGEGAISLSPGNISEGIINYNQCTYISWDKYYESPEIMINNGDIIFCKTASVGKVAVINDLPCEATINPQLVVLKEININKKYLYYYLSSNSIQNKVKSLAGVGSVPNISQSILNDLDISVPSSQVMKSIVEKLDAFESLISSLKEEIALRQKQYEYYREKLLTFD